MNFMYFVAVVDASIQFYSIYFETDALCWWLFSHQQKNSINPFYLILLCLHQGLNEMNWNKIKRYKFKNLLDFYEDVLNFFFGTFETIMRERATDQCSFYYRNSIKIQTNIFIISLLFAITIESKDKNLLTLIIGAAQRCGPIG